MHTWWVFSTPKNGWFSKIFEKLKKMLILIFAAEPRLTNMWSEGFFIYGSLVYSIFLLDVTRKCQLRLAARHILYEIEYSV